MNTNIIYKPSNNKLSIEILSSMKPIVKFGLILQGVLFLAFSVGFSILFIFKGLSLLIPSNNSNYAPYILMVFLIVIVSGVLIFKVGRKYLNRAFHKEILEITYSSLSIIDKYLITKTIRTYPISEISNIRYVGQNKFTSHPMEGKSVDYTGLGVGEKELQYLIEDGTIEIFVNGQIIRFGKNLPSWDAQEIISKIEKFTGNNLQLDDKIEKLMDDLNDI